MAFSFRTTESRVQKSMREDGLRRAPKPSREHLHRIKVLIEELEDLRANTPKPKFNMKAWCEIVRGKSKTFLRKLIGAAVKNPCGTSGCLAGKAGLIPKIRRMGFRWEVLPGCRSHRPATAGFRYKNFTTDAAVRQFFGRMCYWEVFMDMYGINTLLQGIVALKRFHKRESSA